MGTFVSFRMMKKEFMILSRIAGLVAGALVMAGIILVLYLVLTEYEPSPQASLQLHGTCPPLPADTKEFSCFSWNIGYSGLGKEMDFFYEGGTMVQPEKKQMEHYWLGIRNTLERLGNVDFLFLQEVDRDSKRSYHSDQIEKVAGLFPGHGYSFALNYKVGFVPVPLLQPMGKVESGIATFTKFKPDQIHAFSYDARFPLPDRLVMLKRCFMVQRFALEGGNELVLVNLHNSTFDSEGKIRLAELDQIAGFLKAEYEMGHFVVAGGDWNSNPPGYARELVTSGDRVHLIAPGITPELMQGWSYAYDPSAPSNRNVDKPYRKGLTETTLIDFFLVSPNVTVKEVKTIDLGFVHSDHNPVMLHFQIP